MDHGWIAVGISVAVNLVTLAFAAGILWTEMRNLKKAVLNGLSDRLLEHGKMLDRHSEALSAISERCQIRAELTREIKERLAKLEA